MPLANIVDDRTNRYNINCTVVAEHSSHDNGIDGATQFSVKDQDKLLYHEFGTTTIVDAVNWANQQSCPVTLFLYDSASLCKQSMNNRESSDSDISETDPQKLASFKNKMTVDSCTIAEMYRLPMTLRQVAEKLGVSISVVRRRLRDLGEPSRRPGRLSINSMDGPAAIDQFMTGRHGANILRLGDAFMNTPGWNGSTV